MRKIVVLSFVSLDGVMQAPGGPEEDPSESFAYGGWQAPYGDEQSGQEMTKQLSAPFDLLLGRKTYDIFAGYWPKHPEIEEVAGPFNKCTKYVVSHNQIDLPWQGSELITGDVVAKLQELKAGDGPMLQVHGSGKRLFAEGTKPAAFELMESFVSSDGVIFANYKRAGEVKTGTVGA
jgi:dihydrofolate reductase